MMQFPVGSDCAHHLKSSKSSFWTTFVREVDVFESVVHKETSCGAQSLSNGNHVMSQSLVDRS